MSNTTDEIQEPAGAPQGQALLRGILSTVPARLDAISGEHAGLKPAPDKWSKKEELGHLIDSAFNNHRRVIRAQLEDSPALPGYNGDLWVKLNNYQNRDWQELIKLWQSGNRHLLAASEVAPEDAWSRTCTIGDSEPLTLRFVLDDYVDHMLDHLRHIGVETEDLSTPQSEGDLSYPEKPAPANHPINKLMARRWSPRAFEEGRAVERLKIMSLLEAVRWAPSCYNEQPWRYIVFDGTDEDALERARACLVEGNLWAHKAPLLMLSVARRIFTHNGKPNRTARHDVGLATENLVLQAVELGLVTHQMAGFDMERARHEFSIPEGYMILAMIAIGYPHQGSIDTLPETIKGKEMRERERNAISEFAFAGKWGAPYGE